MTSIEPQPDLDLSHDQAAALVESWLGRGIRCTGVDRLAGGMVNSVFRLTLDSAPHRAVVKLHEAGRNDLEDEARALRHLRAETSLPVPAVLHHDGTGDHLPYAALVLEHVPGTCLDELELAPADRADVDRQLGELLADLHDHTATTWGHIDREAPRTGDRGPSWPEIVTARLHEIRSSPALAARLAPAVLDQVDRAIRLAPGVLAAGDPGRPTLVHGDVWNGNILVQQRESTWRITALLDPTAEFADPEWELAYVEVFGQPRPALREVYDQRHPPRADHEHRRLVYWLHTALVHVALFEHHVFRDFTAEYASALIGRG